MFIDNVFIGTAGGSGDAPAAVEEKKEEKKEESEESDDDMGFGKFILVSGELPLSKLPTRRLPTGVLPPGRLPPGRLPPKTKITATVLRKIEGPKRRDLLAIVCYLSQKKHELRGNKYL